MHDAAFHTVDVYTDGAGPALSFPVMPRAALLDAPTMQTLARAAGTDVGFLAPVDRAAEAPLFLLRWFSPHAEIHLCGIGALAAAGLLFARQEASRLRFRTRAGLLLGRRTPPQIAVRLPRYAATPQPPPVGLVEALGLAAPRACVLSEAAETVVLHAADATEIEALRPDVARLHRLQHPHLGAVIVTATGRSCAYVFRYFTPWYGKDESPLALSAHSLLAPYWSARLGATTLQAQQYAGVRPRFQVTVDADGVWIAGRTSVRRTATS